MWHNKCTLWLSFPAHATGPAAGNDIAVLPGVPEYDYIMLHYIYNIIHIYYLLVFIMCVISVCLCLFVSPSTVQSSRAQINYIYIMLIIYVGRQVALHVDTR